jgi:hypothetical protein
MSASTVQAQQDVGVTLAVYMERLDTYISTQSELNRTICSTLEALDNRLDDMHSWRSKVYGAKTTLLAIGFLVVHTTAVMGGFLALVKWAN